jgi:hypothetical protein
LSRRIEEQSGDVASQTTAVTNSIRWQKSKNLSRQNSDSSSIYLDTTTERIVDGKDQNGEKWMQQHVVVMESSRH